MTKIGQKVESGKWESFCRQGQVSSFKDIQTFKPLNQDYPEILIKTYIQNYESISGGNRDLNR